MNVCAFCASLTYGDYLRTLVSRCNSSYYYSFTTRWVVKAFTVLYVHVQLLSGYYRQIRWDKTPLQLISFKVSDCLLQKNTVGWFVELITVIRNACLFCYMVLKSAN